MRRKNKNGITEKRNDRKGKSEEIKISKHRLMLADFWRSWRDLNSRAGNPTYTLSRGAPSANLGTTPCYNRIKEISNLAERIGFEPTVPFGITGFQDQLHKPLGHLSSSSFCIIAKPSRVVNRLLRHFPRGRKRLFIDEYEHHGIAAAYYAVSLFAGIFALKRGYRARGQRIDIRQLAKAKLPRIRIPRVYERY